MSRYLAGLMPLVLLGAAACVKTVELSLPPVPAVHLDTARVAVVAGERACRDIADRLVTDLNALDGVKVDPTAEVRLHVFGCSRGVVSPTVHIDHKVTASGETVSRRRVTLTGARHAVVAVVAGDESRAHLIGTARRNSVGEWEEGHLFAMRRSIERQLVEGVAADLAEQIRPMPRIVQRRIYPNAPDGTARRHLTLAVQAELVGNLLEARRHARHAYETAPTAQARAYLTELERRLDHSSTP